MAVADQLLHMVYEHQGITDFFKADQLFALWMCSPLLGKWLYVHASFFTIATCPIFSEIQLKPHHCPFAIRLQWREMLQRFTTASETQRLVDEPLVMVRRSVYLSKRRQMQVWASYRSCWLGFHYDSKGPDQIAGT